MASPASVDAKFGALSLVLRQTLTQTLLGSSAEDDGHQVELRYQANSIEILVMLILFDVANHDLREEG